MGSYSTAPLAIHEIVAPLSTGYTCEYLGPSDRGIVMIRRRFLRDLDTVARGEDPKAVIRNPERNRSIRLPVADRH